MTQQLKPWSVGAAVAATRALSAPLPQAVSAQQTEVIADMIRGQPLTCVSVTSFVCSATATGRKERTQKGEDSEGNYHVGKEEQYRTKGDDEEGEDAEEEVEEEVKEKQEIVEKRSAERLRREGEEQQYR